MGCMQVLCSMEPCPVEGMGSTRHRDPTLSNQRCAGSRSMDQPRDLSTAQIVQHNPVKITRCTFIIIIIIIIINKITTAIECLYCHVYLSDAPYGRRHVQ